MKPTWIVQTNFASEVHRWITALVECESKFKTIEIVPFSDNVPELEVEGPTICYGTTTLIKNAPKRNYGLFFNEDNFRPSLWKEKYGDCFFNADGDTFPIKHLRTDLTEAFIRPNSDLKDFSGSRVDLTGLVKFKDEVMKGEYPFDGNTEVFIAPLKSIFKEYRVFIVDGKPVAWSQYRLRSMLAKRAEVPQDVLNFASDMADVWSPEKAYVMDVCSDDNGRLYVLELNCFNASGVYLCDVASIVRAVEKLYE